MTLNLRYLFYILIFLLPSHYIFGTIINLGFIPLSLAHLMELTLILLYFSGLISQNRRIKIYQSYLIRNLLLVLLIWTLVSLLSILWASQISKTGNTYTIKRNLNFFEYLVLAFLFLQFVKKKSYLRTAFYVFLFSSGFFLISSFLKSLSIIHVPGLERATLDTVGRFKIGTLAFFPNADGYATWTLPLIPFNIVWLFKENNSRLIRFFLLIILPFIGLGVALNGSRATWLSVLFGGFFTLIILRKVLKTKMLNRIFGLTTLIGFYIVVRYGLSLYKSLMGLRHSTVMYRIIGYQSSLDLVFENWYFLLFGAGKGRFVKLMETRFDIYNVPHDVFLEELVSSGLAGLIGLLIFFSTLGYIAYLNIIRSKKDPLLFSISVVTAVSLGMFLIEGLFANITPTYGLWVMVGFTLSLYRINLKRS